MCEESRSKVIHHTIHLCHHKLLLLSPSLLIHLLEKEEQGESVGYNVYACKTCNKSFTSFQALGGHRTG
ncbi:C2H2-type zinc finger protein [Medicago truncatula]|uniref:C2H2-type zinc finger protein n=1 Tax=Medicago truncatula TaxID=3880 RepID=A0A072VN97_MEDTR|nr:C2H2-type zinc finger protein [Medicago truncatula]